jgi:S1-C subfamily serine protease
MSRRSGILALVGCASVSLGLGLGLGLSLGRVADSTALAASPPVPEHDFTAVARRATPAVVNISAVQIYRAERSPFFSDPFFQFFGGDLPFRVPIEERKTSLGSGVIVSADGLIVTNNHVVQRARQITITTTDRRRRQANLLGSDPATDIAKDGIFPSFRGATPIASPWESTPWRWAIPFSSARPSPWASSAPSAARTSE